MPAPTYLYLLEQCDVPAARLKRLAAYRLFRSDCLDSLRGDTDTSITNQIGQLAWFTAVFETLNEARRIEGDRRINGAMWELIMAGYVSLISIGIRKLVDKSPRTHSVWNVLGQLEKHPEYLTRELYVCYDGLPYDYEDARRQVVEAEAPEGGVVWIDQAGPLAWTTSHRLHKAFDRLAGFPEARKRLDVISPAVIDGLKAELETPVIAKVRALADRSIAHAERMSEADRRGMETTFDEVNEALKIIVRVTHFLSAQVLCDAAFGSVVPTPQFDVLEALDAPWVQAEHLPELHRHWQVITDKLDAWADYPEDYLRPDSAKATP